MALSAHADSAAVKAAARETGFDLVGIARAGKSAYGEAYRRWIAEGRQGEMAYLARNIDERVDLTVKFPWAKSVICVALAYWQANGGSADAQGALADAAGSVGKIARYAWGRDYHKVIEGKLKRLEAGVRTLFPENNAIEMRAYSDTGPILEREFAALAGMGWVGKNTLLIHPRHGSWFLLGEIVTSLELEPDSPLGNHCGTCTRCIDACPTGAIEPYSVDATKCISYLTLEHRGKISGEFHTPMREAGFIVGCDICQEVCPFNRQPLAASEPDFLPREPAAGVCLQDVLQWQEQDWDKVTRGRAFRRAKEPMWKRNAGILSGSTETRSHEDTKEHEE